MKTSRRRDDVPGWPKFCGDCRAKIPFGLYYTWQVIEPKTKDIVAYCNKEHAIRAGVIKK